VREHDKRAFFLRITSNEASIYLPLLGIWREYRLTRSYSRIDAGGLVR
jgi:hypothetical protein